MTINLHIDLRKEDVITLLEDILMETTYEVAISSGTQIAILEMDVDGE